MPDGAAERASTVAQLTGYKPLPNGTRPLPSHPALLPPPQRLSEEGQQEGDAPPELEGEEEAVDEEEECSVGGEGREYALPQLVAELQPMLRCWAVQAWPPPPTSGISSLRIEQASAEVIFSGHGVGGKESPMARSVELRVRFRVAAASEGAEDEKKGRWFQGVLPFVTTDAQDQRGQGPAVRLPVTVEADHVAVRVPLASVGDDSSAASTQLLDKLNARVDAAPASVAAALTALARERGGVSLACRYCRHPLTADNNSTDGGQRLQRFLPLPSEALDDVADFMLCFRDSVLPLSTDQLRARPGHGLCGEGFMLLHATDIVAFASRSGSSSASDRSIACPSCGASLGARVGAGAEAEGDADDVRLWGHALGAMAAVREGGGGGLEYVPILERHYSLATHFALALRGAARRLKKRRFVLRNGAGGSIGAIEVAMWGSEVAVLWGSAQADGVEEEEEDGTPALRVTYEIQEEGMGGVDGHAHGGCDGEHRAHTTTAVVPPPREALELTLPLEEWHAMAALLDASAARDFPLSSHGAFAPARLAYLPLSQTSV